jgi:hypothetical protein
MKRDHTQIQVVYIHMGKTTFLHKGFKGVLVWVHADRLSEVTVAGGV